MKLLSLEKAKVFEKTVLVRADLDVPIKTQNAIEDDTRLVAGLQTIKYLLEHRTKVIVAGHLGRPEKKYHKSNPDKYSLKPIALWFIDKLDIRNWPALPRGKKLEIGNLNGFKGWEIGDNFLLLENLRFYEGEENNDSHFAKKLAKLADIYVNDAFAVCHRSHASIVGVPKYLPHFAGLRLQEEIRVLTSVLQNPKRPLVVIIGGAKIETKLPLVKKMHYFADYVLVGGKIAQQTKVLLKVKAQGERIKNRKAELLIADLNQDKTDMTLKSIENFLQIVHLAKTIVWNGPVGQITSEESEYGTKELAKGIIQSKAYTVVGGGDTVGYLKKVGVIDKFSFVSTGGGAMLEYLSGKKLPGLEALKL